MTTHFSKHSPELVLTPSKTRPKTAQIHPIPISPALANLPKNQVHTQHTLERNLAQQ